MIDPPICTECRSEFTMEPGHENVSGLCHDCAHGVVVRLTAKVAAETQRANKAEQRLAAIEPHRLSEALDYPHLVERLHAAEMAAHDLETALARVTAERDALRDLARRNCELGEQLAAEKSAALARQRELEAQCAAMRDAIVSGLKAADDVRINLPQWLREGLWPLRAALAPDAGKKLLADHAAARVLAARLFTAKCEAETGRERLWWQAWASTWDAIGRWHVVLEITTAVESDRLARGQQ